MIDITWGHIYFLTCKNFGLSVQWPLHFYVNIWPNVDTYMEDVPAHSWTCSSCFHSRDELGEQDGAYVLVLVVVQVLVLVLLVQQSAEHGHPCSQTSYQLCVKNPIHSLKITIQKDDRGMEYTVQKISEKLSRNEKCLSKKWLYHEGKEKKLFKVILDAWFEELFFNNCRSNN